MKTKNEIQFNSLIDEDSLKLKDEIEALNATIEELNLLIENKNKEILKLENDIEGKDDEIEDLETKIDDLKFDIKSDIIQYLDELINEYKREIYLSASGDVTLSAQKVIRDLELYINKL